MCLSRCTPATATNRSTLSGAVSTGYSKRQRYTPDLVICSHWPFDSWSRFRRRSAKQQYGSQHADRASSAMPGIDGSICATD